MRSPPSQLTETICDLSSVIHIVLGGGKILNHYFSASVWQKKTTNKHQNMESTSAAATADLSPAGTQTQVLTVDDLQPQVICSTTANLYFLSMPSLMVAGHSMHLSISNTLK